MHRTHDSNTWRGWGALGLGLVLLGAFACDAQALPVAVQAAPLQGPQDDIAKLCGFACAERALPDGNSVISGVSSVDAFFASVTALARASDAQAAGIEAQLAALGADFGVSGDVGTELVGLTKKVGPRLLRVRAGQPDCRVDAAALLDAQARCDDSLQRDQAQMHCAGACALPADQTTCPAASDQHAADQRCAARSVGPCADLCSGVCTASITNAVCQGDCLGDCDAECSALDANGRCTGPCSGRCNGECRTPLFDAQTCEGRCDGVCVSTNPSGGCKSAQQVECVVPTTGETIVCAGRCSGDPSGADGRPECMVSAKVDAILQLACASAGASVDVIGALAPADPALQARYLNALQNLQRSLPHLLVLAAQGERYLGVADAVAQAATGDDLPKSLQAQNSADVHARHAVGLECAAGQLAGVAGVLDPATQRLTAALNSVDKLRRALGLSP